MKFFEFIFFSMLEYLSFFYFILVLFRFEIKENVPKFVIFSIVLSLISNTFQTESLQAISPLIQAAFMIFFAIFILRVHIFNAVIMIITGYMTYSIIQWTITGIASHLAGTIEIEPYTNQAYIIQTASACLFFVFALIIYLQKGGFSFIDTSSQFKRSKFFTKENRLFIIYLFFSIVVTFTGNILFIVPEHPPYLFYSILLFIGLSGLIYISVKRDEQKG